MTDKRIVLSIFESETAADEAVVALKNSGVARHDAIGILVLDGNGEVKAHKVGSHSFFKGAGIGFILGLLGPVGIGLGMGIGMGATTGGALGLLHHKGLGLSESDRERISAELSNGKAAVGVLAKWDEAGPIESILTDLGGVSEVHAASDEALEEAAASVEAPPATA
ncbi:MAG TPA: hypothetical protein VKB28_16200 [Solirubrobacteraceae bacterium]|nr:hypothetical protein [Solirubrobacteraceae bacterium]